MSCGLALYLILAETSPSRHGGAGLPALFSSCWLSTSGPALRELIDLARITPNVRLPHGANNAVLQRFTNLTMLFVDEPETLSATALLPQAGGQFGLYWRRVPRPPMRVQEEAAAASAAAAAAREGRPAEVEINLVDEDEE